MLILLRAEAVRVAPEIDHIPNSLIRTMIVRTVESWPVVGRFPDHRICPRWMTRPRVFVNPGTDNGVLSLPKITLVRPMGAKPPDDVQGFVVSCAFDTAMPTLRLTMPDLWRQPLNDPPYGGFRDHRPCRWQHTLRSSVRAVRRRRAFGVDGAVQAA